LSQELNGINKTELISVLTYNRITLSPFSSTKSKISKKMAVLAVNALDQQQYINFERANDFAILVHSARARALGWQK